MSEKLLDRVRRRLADRKVRKRLLLAGAAVLLLVLIVLAFRPSAQVVEVASVERGRLEITVDADGVTRVVERFEIAAPVAGRLQRIDLEEGAPVAPGQVVARIGPVPLDPQAIAQARAAVVAAEARLVEANAGVVQARAAMEQAQRTAERIQVIVDAGGMSIEEGEQAQLAATNAERTFDAAESRATAAASDVVAARAVLVDVDPEERGSEAAVDVTSPAGGRVLRVHEPSERVIPAGTPLLDIGDANGLEVVLDVLSTDAVRIDRGARIRIEEWGGEGPIAGSVRLVEPAAFTEISALGVEEQRVNVIGDIADPPTALGDNYRVEASIVVWERPDALKVPASALFRSGDGWAVFVIDGGRARLREVEIGERGTAEAEVLGGLTGGEEVILFPSDQIEDGSRVTTDG